MPTHKRYETPADRQRASRQRQAQAREQEHQHKGFPTAPALATLPSQRRWQSLMEHAHAALMTTQTEMWSSVELVDSKFCGDRFAGTLSS